jgi:rhamnosyltransferase
LKITSSQFAGPSGSPSPLSPAKEAASRVLSVIVSYEPDRQTLLALVESLVAQDLAVLIVDNSESEVGATSARAVAGAYGAEFVCNPRNLGVAEGQNIGLRIARARGFEHVLLLDQDSALEPDTVARLLEAMRTLRARGEPVAAVGPSFVDPRNGLRYPFVRLRHIRMGKFWPQPGDSIECDLLISSGCLIALDTLPQVGEMDSSFFIDYVDIEWCARARAAGLKVFGVSDAKMRHTIGEESVKAFGRLFHIHGPVRNYYFIRNAVLFARKPYLTWRWRVHVAYRIVGQFVLFGALVPLRVERLGWMLRGLLDGLINRRGRLGGVEGMPSMKPRRDASGARRDEQAQADSVVTQEASLAGD